MKAKIQRSLWSSGTSYLAACIAVSMSMCLGADSAHAAPSPSPSPSASPTPPPPPPPKCQCNGGWYYPVENGKCYKQECVTKNVSCSAVGTALTTPGMWGTKTEIACNQVPQPPPSTGGGGGTVGGGTGPKPPAKASPTASPTPTPEPRCPGPDDEGEFGEVGDGGKIGECQDGDGGPIPGVAPVEDPDAPGVCYYALRYCVGGCWFYDAQGVNLVPAPCP